MKIQVRTKQLMELRHGAYNELAHQLKLGNAPASSKAYEKALARLGNTILSEQAPDLLPYTVGFQLLDKSEEGDFAAGFFIFDLGGTLVDCPIFMINGKLKGYQLLHLREQSLFLPLESEIVQYVLSKQDESLGFASFGEGEPRKNRASTNMDVYSSQNRYLQKLSDFKYPPHFDAWSVQSGALESFVSILKSDATQRVKQAAFETNALPESDWENLLDNTKVASLLWHWCQKSPSFSQKIAGIIGEDWAERLTEYYRQQEEEIAKCASFRLNPKSKLSLSGPEVPNTKIAAFESLEGFNLSVDRQPLVDEIIRYGAAFFDERETAKTAAKIAPDHQGDWMSPIESGMYDIALLNGDVRKMVAVVDKNVIRLASRHRGSTFVLDFEEKMCGRARPGEIAARGPDAVELSDFRQPLPGQDSLPSFSPSSYDESQPIVLIDAEGQITEPFIITGGSDDTGWDISPKSVELQGTNMVDFEQTPETFHEGRADQLFMRPDCDRMELVEIAEDKHILVVPSSGTKVLALKSEPAYEGDDRPDPVKLDLLPLSSMAFPKMVKYASFDTQRVTSDVCKISGKQHSHRSAIMYLMASGVSKQSALEVIDNLSPQRQHYAVLDEGAELWQLPTTKKVAISMADMGGDPDYSFREPSEPARGTSDGHFSVPEEDGVRERIVSDGMQFADESAPPWSSEDTPYSEPGEFGGGTPGGQGGPPNSDRSIFTNSLFVSLVSNVNASTDRERVMSGLMRCCDETGRSLFLVYAHGDEYAEAYGRSDAEELEEELLTVFQAAGKLMIRLLSRSVGPTTDLQLSMFSDG